MAEEVFLTTRFGRFDVAQRSALTAFIQRFGHCFPPEWVQDICVVNNALQFDDLRGDAVLYYRRKWNRKALEGTVSQIVICLPAWGEQYRFIAARVVLPAVLMALAQQSPPTPHKFVIYTDDPDTFQALPLDPKATEYRPVPAAETSHEALTAAHIRTLDEAPLGAIVALLDADTLPSRELFTLGMLAFSTGFLVVASLGLRVQHGSAQPPIGVSAVELLDWGWKHRHPLVDECIWFYGKTAFPVTLFFVAGNANAVAHCSHLHPFLVRKEERDYRFRGTIDDGFLHLYREEEIYYCSERQVGFIELSSSAKPIPEHFLVKRGWVLDEDFVVKFGEHYLTSHCRSLRQRFRIIGEKPVYDTPAYVIADRIKGNL